MVNWFQQRCWGNSVEERIRFSASGTENLNLKAKSWMFKKKKKQTKENKSFYLTLSTKICLNF